MTIHLKQLTLEDDDEPGPEPEPAWLTQALIDEHYDELMDERRLEEYERNKNKQNGTRNKQ